jgi:hypothetical protein
LALCAIAPLLNFLKADFIQGARLAHLRSGSILQFRMILVLPNRLFALEEL